VPTISPVSNSALTLLKVQNPATTFLKSSAFSSNSPEMRAELLAKFYDPALGNAFRQAYQRNLKGPDGKEMSADQAKFKALVDVIKSHRDMFSSDEIVLIPPGRNADTVTIPATAEMRTEMFKSQVDAKQAEYDAAQDAKDAQPDPAAIKLQAMSQALQALLPNGDAPTDGDTADAKTAYAILTKKHYGDDEQDKSDHHDQPSTPTQTATTNDPSQAASGAAAGGA
jgi:hypothetical protein